MLEELFNRDDIIPKSFSGENADDFFALLKSPDQGKILSNISEYLLETEGVKGQSKVNFIKLLNVL